MIVETLSVPALQDGGARSHEMRPRRLQEWLAGRPRTGPLESGKSLEQVLSAQNRFALAPDNRLELLELIRPAVLEAGAALQALAGTAGLPAGERVLGAMLQWGRLETELAYGYKRLVRERMAGARHPQRAPALAGLISRSLVHLARLQRAACQAYLPYPAGTWAEIHTLYALADGNGLAGTGEGTLAEVVTPQAAYLQAALLGAANPYGLMAGEARRAAQLLGKIPIAARLTEDASMGPPTAEFVISLTADNPPMALPRGTRLEAAGHVRFLQCLPQVRVVHELVKQLEQGATPATLGLGEDEPEEGLRELLQRLGRAWGLAPRRHATRTIAEGTVEVCLGLGAVHHFVGGAAETRPDLPAPGAGADVFVDLDTLVEVPRAAEAPAPAYEVQAWARRNAGAEGIGIVRQLNGVLEPVRVGEVVGVRAAHAERPWEVATVRWARQREQRIELGLHILGPLARAVEVRARADGAVWHEAVLLPAASGLRRPDTVLLPRSTFAIGTDLLMSDGGEAPIVIRPIQLYDQTGSFDQCVFVRLDGAAS